MGGPLLNVIHCERTRHVMRKALDGGWDWVGYAKSGHVEIRWPKTDQVLHCATTPSDPNSWKAFAREIHTVSGLDFRPKGNRRRSRKNLNRPDPQVEASRRRHAAQQQQEQQQAHAARQDDERRRVAGLVEEARDRQRRELEQLMQTVPRGR